MIRSARSALAPCVGIASVIVSLACVTSAPAAGPPEQGAKGLAGEILKSTGVPGGLIVHIGCGDGKLTAALRAHHRYLVHGLDTDAANVDKAREHIRSLGLYGDVSVEQFSGEKLPYVDNLVNLVVAEDLAEVTMDEVLRVLCPNGVAYVKHAGRWEKSVKPWPEEIDEWTHFLHGPDNNAVADDTRVGPPRRLKWKCGPRWSRSHEFISSVAAMVSGGGRVFYVVDEGVTSVTDERLPERWMLVARDAFNGVLLWKRPLAEWRGDEWKSTALRARPPGVPRRIVADGQRLYATLGHRAPLEVIDAATGETLHAVDGTEGAEEILLSGRILVLRLAETVAGGRGPRGSIVSIDADAGQVRWSAAAGQYAPQSLAAAAGRVVYSTGKEIVCLSLADGSESWRVADPDAKARRRRQKTLILHDTLVVEAGGPKIVARSAATGETLWTAPGAGKSMQPTDVFIAQGCVWHASAEGITGYDMASGKPSRVIDPSCVQTPGHHLRCYRAKATERFLITQFRGAEFVSLGDDNHVNNDWVRGACRYGVMPANGLLYVPPSPCFCYPGVKLTGFLALAASRDGGRGVRDERPRLERGTAYDAIINHQSSIINRSDWPTYRHDARRSGAAVAEVPAKVSARWQVRLPGPLTPPVACANRVYVAAKDRHTLYALASDDGRQLWCFTAGGRIDSPPTVHGGLVLFGCADGAVYCLRAADGELAWRFRAAPREERIVAFGRLESPWRVHGSVLVEDGIVYCTAGRSTFLDGGIWIYGLDPKTGTVVHKAHLDTWAPSRGDFQDKPFIPSYHMEGTHSDILVSQNDHIYLGQYKLDLRLAVQDTPYVMGDPHNPVVAMDIFKQPFTLEDPDLAQGFQSFRGFHRYMEQAHPELAEQYEKRYGGMNMGDRRMGLHLVATGGFLDDAWFNRTYWMYSANWPGWYHAHRGAKSGQLLVIGPERTYALQAFPTRNRQSPLFTPGNKGYLLLADYNDTEPVLDHMTRGATKGMGYTRLKPPAWFDWVPIRIRGLVLAGKNLFVAGPPDVVDPNDPMASFEGRKGALLWAVCAETGRKLAEYRLDSPPVFDGLIAANGRLNLTTVDGRVLCFAP